MTDTVEQLTVLSLDPSSPVNTRFEDAPQDEQTVDAHLLQLFGRTASCGFGNETAPNAEESAGNNASPPSMFQTMFGSSSGGGALRGEEDASASSPHPHAASSGAWRAGGESSPSATESFLGDIGAKLALGYEQERAFLVEQELGPPAAADLSLKATAGDLREQASRREPEPSAGVDHQELRTARSSFAELRERRENSNRGQKSSGILFPDASLKVFPKWHRIAVLTLPRPLNDSLPTRIYQLEFPRVVSTQILRLVPTKCRGRCSLRAGVLVPSVYLKRVNPPEDKRLYGTMAKVFIPPGLAKLMGGTSSGRQSDALKSLLERRVSEKQYIPSSTDPADPEAQQQQAGANDSDDPGAPDQDQIAATSSKGAEAPPGQNPLPPSDASSKAGLQPPADPELAKAVFEGSPIGTGFARSMLFSNCAWKTPTAANELPMAYVVLDLGRTYSVAGISSQGRRDAREWTGSYRVWVNGKPVVRKDEAAAAGVRIHGISG